MDWTLKGVGVSKPKTMVQSGMAAFPVVFAVLLMTACQGKNNGPTTGLQNPMAPLVAGSQTPTLTSTPTYNTTPHCGFTLVQVNGFAAIQTSPTLTPVVPVATYSLTPNLTPVPYGGYVRVVRSLADWQNTFGDQAPPIDFSTHMLLQTGVANGCDVSGSFRDICVDSTQVTVTVQQSYWISAGMTCNEVHYGWISASFDQSNLPVVWQVVSP